MSAITLLTLLPTLLLLSLPTTHAWSSRAVWQMELKTLVREQLDPIVSPNKQSSHMHRILGGSQFGASYDYDEQINGTCTTALISADKSNYWMPQLYWYTNNSIPLFYPMRTVTRTYYFGSRMNGLDYPVQPFPKGLRMLTGDPNLKDPSGYVNGFYYVCYLDEKRHQSIQGSDFNFDAVCLGGLKTQIIFPSCWDGVNLYKKDGTHVSFPYGDTLAGACPYTHPVHMPGIMLEYGWFYPPEAAGIPIAGHHVWANGDTTGCGIHGDFVNGWDIDVLTAALKSPECTDVAGDISFADCPVFKPYVNEAAWESCVPQKGGLLYPNGVEDLMPSSALPGCNPLWSSGPKPTCDPAVAPLAGLDALLGTDGPLTVPAGTEQSIVFPTGETWEPVGCFQDGDYAKALVNKVQSFVNNGMTVDSCTASCEQKNLPYASVEVRGTTYVCSCGTAFDPTSIIMFSGCDSPCPGDSSQKCGGVYLEQVYYKNLYPGSGLGANATNGTTTTGTTSNATASVTASSTALLAATLGVIAKVSATDIATASTTVAAAVTSITATSSVRINVAVASPATAIVPAHAAASSSSAIVSVHAAAASSAHMVSVNATKTLKLEAVQATSTAKPSTSDRKKKRPSCHAKSQTAGSPSAHKRRARSHPKNGLL